MTGMSNEQNDATWTDFEERVGRLAAEREYRLDIRPTYHLTSERTGEGFEAALGDIERTLLSLPAVPGLAGSARRIVGVGGAAQVAVHDDGSVMIDAAALKVPSLPA